MNNDNNKIIISPMEVEEIVLPEYDNAEFELWGDPRHTSSLLFGEVNKEDK